MKSVFFGGNQLSTIVLQKLLENNIRPDLIITSPDEPTGKKRILTPPPLKLKAQELNLETLQPVSLKKDLEIITKIKNLEPSLGIVAAYGKLIPKNILEIFPKGVLNLHPSLLPKYRGPSPIQTAILDNEKETGVSIISLDEQMDHGPILTQEKITLSGEEYFQELYEKLADWGGEILARTIPLWLHNKIAPLPQDDSKATVCKKLEWQDGKIILDDTTENIYAKIRALGKEPGCWIEIGEKKLIIKIIRAKPITNHDPSAHKPIVKTRFSELNKELILACKNGALLLEQVQPEGKKVISGKEFLNGYRHELKIKIPSEQQYD